MEIYAQRWEHDEFVITFDGKPVGQTLDKRDALLVARWLRTATSELQKVYEDKEQKSI